MSALIDEQTYAHTNACWSNDIFAIIGCPRTYPLTSGCIIIIKYKCSTIQFEPSCFQVQRRRFERDAHRFGSIRSIRIRGGVIGHRFVRSASQSANNNCVRVPNTWTHAHAAPNLRALYAS